MFMLISKIGFLLFSVLFLALLFCFEIMKKHKKAAVKLTKYAGLLSFFLLMYVVFGFLLTLLFNKISMKVIMTGFAISPFIIGRFAKYDNLSLYKLLTVTTMLAGIIIVGASIC